jgi:hypothetical protein
MRSNSIKLKKFYILIPISLIIMAIIFLSMEKNIDQVAKEEPVDISEFTE